MEQEDMLLKAVEAVDVDNPAKEVAAESELRRILDYLESDITNLAVAFRTTWNIDLSRQLFGFSHVITAVCEKMQKLSCRISSARLRDAQAASGNMLSAALAMSELRSEGESELKAVNKVMLEALEDVAASGLIKCCCNEEPCCGTCTAAIVDAAIKKAKGVK